MSKPDAEKDGFQPHVILTGSSPSPKPAAAQKARAQHILSGMSDLMSSEPKPRQTQTHESTATATASNESVGANDVPTSVVVRAYKHREQNMVLPSGSSGDLGTGKEWCLVKGALSPVQKHDCPGFDVYKVNGVRSTDKLSLMMPCKALITVEDQNGQLLKYQNVTYSTVQLHPPAPTMTDNTQTLVSVDVSTKLDVSGYDSLPDKRVIEIGKRGDPVMVLLYLKKGSVDALVAKDDITGDGYPYILDKCFILIATKPPVVSAVSAVSAVDAKAPMCNNTKQKDTNTKKTGDTASDANESGVDVGKREAREREAAKKVCGYKVVGRNSDGSASKIVKSLEFTASDNCGSVMDQLTAYMAALDAKPRTDQQEFDEATD